MRKLGNRRSSEKLHCFNSSKGTNLAILIILAGDIETNPGPSVVFAKKYCKVSDKMYWLRKNDSGYPQDGHADKNPYPHDRHADKDSYPCDSNNQCIILRLQLFFVMINVQLMPV